MISLPNNTVGQIIYNKEGVSDHLAPKRTEKRICSPGLVGLAINTHTKDP